MTADSGPPQSHARRAAPNLILVCGPSGCGKSTLAEALAFSVQGVALVQQDQFFTRPFVSYSDRSDDSFEGPAHIDWEGLRHSVQLKVESAALVIVEGHLVAVDQELVAMATLVVTLRCPQDVCKDQRLRRRPRPPQETEELSKYIDRFVWPAFLLYGLPALDS
ncbi:unnamed protein product, partial [Polarella glacialis]